MSGTRRSGDREHRSNQRTERASPAGSAAEEAALADRITGPGSGPYSGTPFPSPPGALDEEREPDEAEQHEHGIIDEVRHVSSIGRR